MWWEHFKSMQPAGREVTWAEFKKAFKDHHISKALMVRKMKELLALNQGDDIVYQYAEKFNYLFQYGEHNVYTDAKKMERFRDGLKGDLYGRLLTVYIRIKLRVDFQVDKSSVVVKGPFFPQV
jgi:hypothetical protein